MILSVIRCDTCGVELVYEHAPKKRLILWARKDGLREQSILVTLVF